MEQALRATSRTQVTKLINSATALLNNNVAVGPLIATENLERECETVLDYNDRAVTAIAHLEFRLDKLRVELPSRQEAQSLPPAAQGSILVAAKLPKLELRKFNGDIAAWLPFWEEFRTAVHENTRLDGSAKFNYLRSVLTGKAAASIAGFTPTEACYNDAITMLKEEYGSTDRIVEKCMQNLMMTDAVKTKYDISGLRYLYNNTIATMRSLKVLGISANLYAMMVKSILLRSIPNEMRTTFHRQTINDTGATSSSGSVNSDASSAAEGEMQVQRLLNYIKVEVEALEKSQDAFVGDVRARETEKKTERAWKSTAAGLLTSVEGGTTAHVQAIVKGKALLPCDLTPPAPNDSVVLVVWYKDEHTPIYSYDTRGSHSTLAKHWKDGNIEARAFFNTIREPSALSIDNISEKDEGEYRCRIDYLRSPTKNLRVKLTVIVPPQKPTIIDEKGKEVVSVAGPYDEGGDMKLTCIVTGGKPEPSLRWWRGEKLIDSMDTRSGFASVRSNQLIVRGLQRSDQHATFICQASNNNFSQPVSASITVEIYFRPLIVELMSSNQPLSADRRYEMPCQTYGSRPPAKISWWMESKELKPYAYNFTQSNSPDGNMSTSILTFTPSRLENGRALTCRATNPLVQGGVEESTMKLNVFYVPILHLALGSNLNPDDIEEGDDVYFECKVNANPWAYKVLWKHNGQIVQPNQKKVIMSNSDLALQGISRSQAGNYSCTASNVEGDGDSNIVELKVMYKPVCRPNLKQVYGVARHENAKVLCEVEAYPPPDNFKWSFNNTANTIEVPQTRFQSGLHHSSSTLTYTPVTELDYGTVMCWASNLAGRQQEPCVFHIMAASKPDPPYNCTILNQTSDSLEVQCVEGFDGGQPQYFQLEVYDHQTGVLQANASAKFATFNVSGLDSGRNLRMMVYAANSKGRSESVLLEGFTLKVAEKQTVLSLGTRDQIEIAPMLGILVGIVTALLLVSVVILGALKIRASRREGSHALRPGFLPVKEKVTLPLRSESEDLFEKDDKNPDVVPANKDSDYQLGSAAQTPGLNNSVISAEYEAPGQHITPLTEAYITRDRAYAPQPVSNEVTYAELSIARPNSLEPIKNGGNQYGSLHRRDEPTIYAQIDHGRRPPPAPVKTSITSPIISPVSSLFPTAKPGIYHREVVTVRTPLMGCQQESCV